MYGAVEYAGGLYGGPRSGASPVQPNTKTSLAVEIAFTTDALETPAWVDVTPDVRVWNTTRGRNRELERYQPGRATVVLGNLSRQYDSQYTAGPWFGNLKPMRRIRIRETFNGVTHSVFDGFVDRWQLGYPQTGKDATATVTATDAFKVFARTGLPRSVYEQAVIDDGASIYWRLDESKTNVSDSAIVALNYGTLGAAGDGTYVGDALKIGQEGLVVNDPGRSIELSQDVLGPAGVVELQGVTIDDADFDLFDHACWVWEAWVYPTFDQEFVNDSGAIFECGTGATSRAQLIWDPADDSFKFAVSNDATIVFVALADNPSPILARYHVAAKFKNTEVLGLWVNGVQADDAADAPSGVFTGAQGNDTHVGHDDNSANNNWVGRIAHAAIYVDSPAEAYDGSTALDHYDAGSTPWVSDLPGARIRRVLVLADWPGGPSYPDEPIDTGAATFQSATTNGQTVLEHIQKCAESEYGLLFVDRAGGVRFVDQTAVFARTAYPDAVFGDDTGEVGYRSFTPDEGDTVIRNSAKISRLNGPARTAEDAGSVTGFGRFQYTLEGLLHASDTYSQTYADLIVGESAEMRRRVTSLVLGPAGPDTAATLYPQMLGRELADVITVRHRPPGGGDLFAQACVIEGIDHQGQPGGIRTCVWKLSPAPSGIEPVPVAELLAAEDGAALLTEDSVEIEVE